VGYAVENARSLLDPSYRWSRIHPRTWRCVLCGGKTVDRDKHGGPDRPFSSCSTRMGANYTRRQRQRALDNGMRLLGQPHGAARCLADAVRRGIIPADHPGIIRVSSTTFPVDERHHVAGAVPPYRWRWPGDRYWPLGYMAGSAQWWARAELVTAMRHPWGWQLRAKLAVLILDSPLFLPVWDRLQPAIEAAERLKLRSGAPVVKRLVEAYGELLHEA